MHPLPDSIEDMYPRVPVSIILSQEWQQRFIDYFLASGELPADPFEFAACNRRPQKKCVAVSLFRQAVDNRVPHEFPVDEARWREKYWNHLLALVADLPQLPDWKLRIYVENSLWNHAATAFAEHPQVELCHMKVDSIGASPGTLWRFLALGDRELDLVLETDIDEPLTTKLDHIRSFEMHSGAAIGRLGGFLSDRHYLVHPEQSAVKNYATLIASRVMSRPSMWDFDVAAALRGFMAFRKHRSRSERPWAYSDSEEPSAYNAPIGAHTYGWGSHWYMYCFDERFLKHVVYYHFADGGKIHTWAPSLPPSQLDPEGIRDLEYTRLRGNITVNPHTAVRLAPLELAPEALRIAFTLEEHRWIFDFLLRIMQAHAHTGYCGNVFFHDMADPWFIELVPKQLNLFNVARHGARAAEIGFNAGHSAAIMLLANPRLTIRAFDTCGLAYTKPCLEFLNSILGNRIALVEGPSQCCLPIDPITGYDLVHIDADHTCAAVATDLANALPKCCKGAIIVMDDLEGVNDVARATHARTDLIATEEFTVRRVFPGSSHGIFRHNGPGR